MRIERAVNYVTALGPGRRLCVWVNGCSRGCKGCVSERLQKIDPTTETDIDEYFFGYNLSSIEGVTVSGGEPFEQREELLRLLKYFKRKGVKDILVYTGYTLEELQKEGDEKVEEILKLVSVLIDGAYVAEQDLGTHNLKGSENQRILYLDESVKEKYEAYVKERREMQEMQLANVKLGVGIPTAEYIEKFKK